ncbi:MAG: ComF family protein [Proteobacteria bacterium]|nr:ComF family protein [Pseudomonadota bacterium]MBU4582937.1 ComF family protein [Pseudomonadota bacterium]
MKEILTGIADLIFPPRCITCEELLEQHGPLPFCPRCMAGIRFIGSPLCPRCGTPFPAAEGEDHLCGECLITERPYAVARSVGRYEETLLTAIHRFKYRGKTGIGDLLSRIMADFAGKTWEMKVFERILPVPLHRRRLRERGFNQAVILARGLSTRFNIPLDFTVLRRNIFTPPQVGLDRKERSANVQGAFTVTHPERIVGRRLLLVDDVYTTGSTLTECARVLIRAKAEAVAVLTMARAVYDHDRPPEPAPTFLE